MTVNLLPPNIKREKELRKIAKLTFVFFGVVFGLIIAFSVTLHLANLTTKKNISANEKKIAQQESILKELEPTAQKIKIINAKIDKISAIDQTRIIWSSVIKDLANDTPRRVKLESLSLEGDSNKINLTGSAETRRDIAAFKDKLEASGFFKNVTFSTSSHNQDTNSYSFNLNCEIENKK